MILVHSPRTPSGKNYCKEISAFKVTIAGTAGFVFLMVYIFLACFAGVVFYSSLQPCLNNQRLSFYCKYFSLLQRALLLGADVAHLHLQFSFNYKAVQLTPKEWLNVAASAFVGIFKP